MDPSERVKLYSSLVAYFASQGLPETAEALRRESGVESSAGASEAAQNFERKWTSILRLERRVLELEKEVDEVTTRGTKGHRPPSKVLSVPRGPAALTLKGFRSAVLSVAAHPSLPLIAAGSEDGTLKVVDLDRRHTSETLTHLDAVNDVQWGPENPGDGSALSLASASADGTARIWNSADWKARTLKGHSDAVVSVRFVSKRYAVTACKDSHLRLFDADTGRLVRASLLAAWPRCLSSAQTTLAVACTGMDFALVYRFNNDDDDDGGGDYAAEGRSLTRPTAELPSPTRGHQVQALAVFHKDDKDDSFRVAVASRDNNVYVWKVNDGDDDDDGDQAPARRMIVATLAGHAAWVRSIAWYPDGKRLVTGGDDKVIKAWDVEKERALTTIEAAHSGSLTSLALSLPAALLASAGDRVVKLWDSCR